MLASHLLRIFSLGKALEAAYEPKIHSLQIFHLHRDSLGGFPGAPVLKTLSFQCKRHGFDLWSGN